MKIQKILLSRIDVSADGWDQFVLDPAPTNVPRLVESLERVGQIHPLVLRKDMDWLFLVTGYARYLAFQKLGIEEAWARIFMKNELSDEQALWIAVEETCLLSYSPARQKRIIERFMQIGYTEKDVAEKVARAIGLPATIEAVHGALGS